MPHIWETAAWKALKDHVDQIEKTHLKNLVMVSCAAVICDVSGRRGCAPHTATLSLCHEV